MRLPFVASLVVASGLVCMAGTASAQDAPPPPVDPLPPPAEAVTTTTTTTTTTETHEEEHHRHFRPHFVIGVQGGLGAYTEGSPFSFDSGTGSATKAGAAWGARVGFVVLRWLAFEAHYDGIYNKGNELVNQGGSVGLLTSAGTAVVRFTAPLHFVQPYVFAGFGIYHHGVTGSTEARAATPFHSSTEPGVPIGVGVDFALCHHLTLGAEVTYHRLFGESFSEVEEIGGGDPITATLAVRMHL